MSARPDADLLDPAFYVGDPHPAYRWMRRHEPVYRDEQNALWASRAWRSCARSSATRRAS